MTRPSERCRSHIYGEYSSVEAIKYVPNETKGVNEGVYHFKLQYDVVMQTFRWIFLGFKGGK